MTSMTVVRDQGGFWNFVRSQLRPRGKIFTPFNVISVPIMLLGLGILVVRFTKGLGAVTNLSQEYPWGFWIGFDVVTGVAFAGGAYIDHVRRLHHAHGEVPPHRPCHGPQRPSGLCLLRRRSGPRPGPALEHHQPDHRQ